MEYKKQVMRIGELKEMGFPESYLMRIFRLGIRDIAWKSNPAKENSVILFDTVELEKYRKAHIEKRRGVLR